MRGILFFLIILFAVTAHSAPESDWVLKQLKKDSVLALAFNGADAVIGIRDEVWKGSEKQIRPTILLFKIKSETPVRPAAKADWKAFLATQVDIGKSLTLRESLNNGRYILEVTAPARGSPTDFHSLYFAEQAEDGMIWLLVYDGLGGSVATNLPLVQKFFSTLSISVLKDLYNPVHKI